MRFEFGVAFAPARGEDVCGDAWVVVEHASEWWACVVDGLGHGPAAADAARTAIDFAQTWPDRDLAKMLLRLDTILKPTRGAAVSLIHCDRTSGVMSFTGVGNVELRTRTRVPFGPITTPGIVGRGIRKTLVLQHRLVPGDLLVLATDGLSSRLDLLGLDDGSMPGVAQLLLASFRRFHDDALCLAIVVREGES